MAQGLGTPAVEGMIVDKIWHLCTVRVNMYVIKLSPFVFPQDIYLQVQNQKM